MSPKKRITVKQLEDRLTEKISKSIGTTVEDLLEKKAEHPVETLIKKIDSIADEGERKNAKIAAFYKALFTDDRVMLKALSEGTDTAGGYLVPDIVRAAIIERVTEMSHIRQRATVIPMTSDTLNLPRLDDYAIVSWTSENAAISTSTLRFGRVQLTPYKLAVIIYISSELVEDANVNIVQFITNHIADRIRLEEEKTFINGDGSSKPTGIAQTSGIGAVDAGGDGSGDDLINALYTLAEGYRRNAVWIMHKQDIAEVRRLKDSNNRYLWSDGFDQTPPTILGRPVLESDWLALGTILVGDPTQYYIGDRRKMQVKISDTAGNAWTYDQISIRVTERVDGKLAVPSSFVAISNFSA